MTSRVFPSIVPAVVLMVFVILYARIALAQRSSGTPAAVKASSAAQYVVPRTPWGDPDIQGVYTNRDEYGTPFERPPDLADRKITDFNEAEMAVLRKQRLEQAARQARSLGGTQEEDTGAGPSHWYEHLNATNAQPWFIVEPADGMVPTTNPEGQRRATARLAARKGRGPSDSWTDRSLTDRCITRGAPGSMIPGVYGAAYDITQGPGVIVIRTEMIHEARVILLDARPALAPAIRQLMGDARGRWDGETLVVTTTGFDGRVAYRGSGDRLTMTERFTPTGPGMLRWEVRFEDPATWDRSWAFAMPLRPEATPIFEYACHEGNYGLANILSAARASERKGHSP
jgi:hypothetical protein